MNKSSNQIPAAAPGTKEPFRFFPPRDTDPVFEGRDPHESVKTDSMGRQFPRPWHIGVFLFGVSLVVYLASMSWSAFPGLPTQLLLVHLKLEPTPGTLNLLWGWGVRLADRLPGLSVAGWMGMFSAVCGAGAVGLLGLLMTRVAYLIRNEPGVSSFLREAQARRLSGLVAGLYLLGSIPFWVVSTRSLPGSFHVLWLLGAAWAFSQYQLWGRWRYLFLLGLIYGAGLTEFATFLVFLPLAVFLVAREMFRWQVFRAWRPQLVLWSGLGLGLLLYAFNAVVLYRHGLPVELYATPTDALLQIWKEQAALILQVRYSPGFFVVMFFCLAPWLTLFTMSRRSPWFYEWGQIVVRLIFVGGLLAALYNASFAPWNLMGMQFLVVMPSVLMAVSMGYMAGEFWILGERHLLLDFWRIKRVARGLSNAFALLLPVAIVAGAVRNWPEADGRHGAIINASARDVLDRIDGPKIVFTAGVLDDALRIAIRERWARVVLISAPRVSSPIYLKQLSKLFPDPSLSQPLERGNFDLFLDNLMMSEQGPRSTVVIDLPDIFRQYGHLLPDGFFYRIQVDAPAPAELAAQVAAQQDFWVQMEQVAKQLPPEQNPAFIYQKMLCLMASRIANNLGVVQADLGDVAGAAKSFRTAWRIFPENASALLNLLGAAHQLQLPDIEDIENAWADRMEQMRGERWGLAIQFGHVWEARQWLRRGWVWALSGVPVTESGSRYAPPKPEAEEESEQVVLLDKALLQWGLPRRDEAYHRSLLMRDPRNTESLLSLCRLALSRHDFAAAEAYMQEALGMGLPEEQLMFERAMAAFMRGERESAVEQVERLSHIMPGDVRIWVALILLTDAEAPLNAHAIRILRNHHSANAASHIVMGSVYMARGQWNDARAQLERAVELDSRNTQAWEMLMTVAQEINHPRLIQAAARALVARDPLHYLQFQNRGIAHYEKGELEEAEKVFREGIARRRHPTLLNNLAHIIAKRGGNLHEALSIVNEALRRQPGMPSILNTRADILMKLGRLPEARADVVDALRRQGRNMDPLLDLAVRYQEQGDLRQARALVKVADGLSERLNTIQQQRLEALRQRLDGAPAR
jgi:tetratricopeptide (TPR) repeat protein